MDYETRAGAMTLRGHQGSMSAKETELYPEATGSYTFINNALPVVF